MSALVYFSSTSENTHRFVERLGVPAQRIPLRATDPGLAATEPYVLLVPTYGGGYEKGAIPKQVGKFLNDPGNRALLRGVIASGNTNFGVAYCVAGPMIAAKCGVPYLYGFEILGTPEDVTRVRDGLDLFWHPQLSSSSPA
jgi:protein involved in ribonucleotide reduction